MKRIIHWFRRDLRISDNKSLYAACRDGDEVIPVYILSSWKRHHPWTGANRQDFLCGCLTSLAKNLEEIGGRLILRSGSPVKELIELAKETQADAIYFSENYAPYDREIEERIQKAALAKGIRVPLFKDTVIVAPGEVLSQSGQPFRIFTAMPGLGTGTGSRSPRGDIPANNGGWQWSAGTGADAAPYFRIQNPWTQTAEYDPDGGYIKRWVSELRDVKPSRLTKPPEEKLAPDYPLPMVDHYRERGVTLERFRSGAAS